MYIVEVKGYKIEARAVGLQETEITVNGKYYDTYYGNYLNCPGDFISPLAADIRAGFVPFVGWPEENEDNKIFSEAIHWDGDPEDWTVVDIPFLGEPMHQPYHIGESGL